MRIKCIIKTVNDANLSLTILLCSICQMVMKSLQKGDHTLKKSKGVGGFPLLLNWKYFTTLSNLRQNVVSIGYVIREGTEVSLLTKYLNGFNSETQVQSCNTTLEIVIPGVIKRNRCIMLRIS